MLVLGRAVAGIGSSGMMNGGFTIVAIVSKPEKRASMNFPTRVLAELMISNVSGIYNGLCLAWNGLWAFTGRCLDARSFLEMV